MGYNPRLARESLARRVPSKVCYMVTSGGRRVALFLTKAHARVLRPGLQALDVTVTARVPPSLRRAFEAPDIATEALFQAGATLIGP